MARRLAQTCMEHGDLPFWAVFTKCLEGEVHVARLLHVISKFPCFPTSARVRSGCNLDSLYSLLYFIDYNLMPPRLSSKRVLSLNTLCAYARSPSTARTRSLVTVLNVRSPRAGKGKACAVSRAGPPVREQSEIVISLLMGTESLPCVICFPSTERPLPGVRCQEGC